MKGGNFEFHHPWALALLVLVPLVIWAMGRRRRGPVLRHPLALTLLPKPSDRGNLQPTWPVPPVFYAVVPRADRGGPGTAPGAHLGAGGRERPGHRHRHRLRHLHLDAGRRFSAQGPHHRGQGRDRQLHQEPHQRPRRPGGVRRRGLHPVPADPGLQRAQQHPQGRALRGHRGRHRHRQRPRHVGEPSARQRRQEQGHRAHHRRRQQRRQHCAGTGGTDGQATRHQGLQRAGGWGKWRPVPRGAGHGSTSRPTRWWTST